MADNISSRRRFLRTLPAVVGLTAGCQAPRLGTTPTDESTPTATPPEDPISTDLTLDPLSYHPTRARVIREFLPQASPASIAVGFPSERTATTQGYCFDAGPCRLRYAWAGDFISIPYVKDDGPAELGGKRYYRAQQGFPLRFGGDEHQPDAVEFQGYSLVDRLPQFRYEADSVEIRQLVRPLADGRGFEQTFEIPDLEQAVWYVPSEENGLSTDASAGKWSDGRLRVPADAAAEFTVTLEVQS